MHSEALGTLKTPVQVLLPLALGESIFVVVQRENDAVTIIMCEDGRAKESLRLNFSDAARLADAIASSLGATAAGEPDRNGHEAGGAASSGPVTGEAPGGSAQLELESPSPPAMRDPLLARLAR